MKLYIPRLSYGDEPLHTHCLLQLQKRLLAIGLDHSFAVPFFDSHINRGRNRVAANFLATDCDMMLSVDADIVFAPENVERLIESCYAFVGAVYPMKTDVGGGSQVVGSLYDPIERDDNGFVRAADIGAGFCLLRREVFETLARVVPTAINDIANGDGKEYSVFYDSGLDGKQYLTEDWWISRAYHEAGGAKWLDGNASLGHIGTKMYAQSATINQTLDTHCLFESKVGG